MARPNYLTHPPSSTKNEDGVFPPRYIDCHECRTGVLIFEWESGSVISYRCDEDTCKYHKKQRTYQHGCWFGFYIMSPMFIHFEESGKGFAPLADCLFMCCKCMKAKTGMNSKEATAGFIIEREIMNDRVDDYEVQSFICDACLESAAKEKTK